MNIENLHGTLKAGDILDIHPTIKEAFNNYEDAKLKKLSIFFYNNTSQVLLAVKGYSFNNKNEECEENYQMNYFNSTFQMFCGKIGIDRLLFVDFVNMVFIYVKEPDLDAYMSLFLNENRPLVTDNDFKPFKDMILSFKNNQNEVDFEEVEFLKDA